MFDNLKQNLSKIVSKLRNKGYITDHDIDIAMREIRIVLLEADVSFSIVKTLIDNIKHQLSSLKIVKSIAPGKLIINIVYKELVALMTSVDDKLCFNSKKLSSIMLVGVQGSGKTTTSVKLALCDVKEVFRIY